MNALIPIAQSKAVGSTTVSIFVPTMIADAGDQAARRFLEFFAATIRNKNTRMAYYRAVVRFFAWCDQHQLGELVDHRAAACGGLYRGLAAGYREAHGQAAPGRHPHAVRLAGDGRHRRDQPGACGARAEACRETRQDTGADAEEARELLDSIDTSTVVGLRDRALIGVMTFTFARIGAVVAMRVEDYYPQGKRWWVRLHEKGGKRHEMPAHHTLEAYLDAYLDAAGIRDSGKSPLFRSRRGHSGTLTDKAMHRVDAYRMIHRRAAAMGLKVADQLPHLPGDRHHRLSGRRRHARKRPAHGRARKPAHDQAL